MAKIVMIGNMKGGIGKSTATLLAATALSQAPFNRKVLVLDLDRQASLVELRELDQDDTNQFSYEIRSSTVEGFYNSLEEIDENFDLVFLDTGGKLDNNLPFDKQEITPVLFNTDLLLVPFVAGNFGTAATLKYLEYAYQVKHLKKSKGQDLEILGFVNQYTKNRKEDEQLDNFLNEISRKTGLKFMDNKLGYYSAYKGPDTIKSLYKKNPTNSHEHNFKMWIKELDKTL